MACHHIAAETPRCVCETPCSPTWACSSTMSTQSSMTDQSSITNGHQRWHRSTLGLNVSWGDIVCGVASGHA